MNEEKIFKVSEFNEFVNLYLSKVGEVVVEGEISQIQISQNRWLFMTIKDEDSSVDIFSPKDMIAGYNLLEQGMLVHVYGSPRLYQKTGRFSIFANQIVPAGEGALRIAYEKLKAKLLEEGLFDAARKRRLPEFPEEIGLITADDSQAYNDFVKVLRERMGGLKILFCPIQVQGRDSVKTILGAFDYFNKNLSKIDLIVLTRGGGSLEDLQSFNDERVVRAIFSSKVPVVCGIGHEKDESLADLVADLRASTPSNAAELIVRHRGELARDVDYKISLIEGNIRRLIKEKNDFVLQRIHILSSAVEKQIGGLREKINKFGMRFELFVHQIITSGQRINNNLNNLIRGNIYWIEKNKDRLESLTRLFNSLDYHQVLRRGFSITFDINGAVIKSINQVKKGQDIKTSLFNGKIGSRVLNMEKWYDK